MAEQDRNLWDKHLIEDDIQYLNLASSGTQISIYLFEAAISYEHCAAASFEETNWNRILGFYDLLCANSYSPVRELNRIEVIMHIEGVAIALEQLNEIQHETKLDSYYLYYCSLEKYMIG